jgi:ATP-dependent helicase/nuclease subunit A
MSQLTIYKASAGSGKTFRLVVEYLKLLVVNPFNYRHILAVTFTNKATAEMKERILRDLFKVAKNADSKLVVLLESETGLGQMRIVEHAEIALANILHDYDRFAVSTIDSFFQRVLRSFARETGLYGAYEIELDQTAVIEEACDKVLLSAEHDAHLRNWLIDMSESQLNEGKNWQFRENIMALGVELMKEPYQKQMVHRLSPEAEREKLNELRGQLSKTQKWFEGKIREFGKSGMQIIADNQINNIDFKGGSQRSFAKCFSYWMNFLTDKIIPTATTYKCVDNLDEWYTKTSPYKANIIACYENGLNSLLKEAIEFIGQNYPVYITAVEIGKNIYSLGVLTVLSEKMREVGREKNALLLSEGNTLLNGIIGNNDAPFIYEKAGNYYNFFMIDEFQDTSLTQWENFRPLVANSLAENHPNLVVGDVKQSIYRWRNSDWQLLDKVLKQELGHYGVTETTLNANWRSCENVVDFNNLFFDTARKILQDDFNKLLGDNKTLDEHRGTIVNAFADVAQKVASGKTGGMVSCSFIDKEDYHEETLIRLVQAIENVQDEGFEAGDIAILVKRNDEGKKVAEALLKHKKKNQRYNFEVISDDTLFIETSASVRFITGMMRYIATPFDKVVQATVVHEFATNLLPMLEKQKAVPPRFSEGGQQQLSFVAVDPAKFIPTAVVSDFFPFMENEKMKPLLRSWGNRTVPDLAEELMARYHLDRLPGEQANLQAFKDVVGDFARRESGSLHKFIEWWEQNGRKVKLQTAGQRNAIRIMTIHKSKGLEFPVVMVPFCDWNFAPSSTHNSILWCSTHGTPFNQFPAVPVKYSNKLKDSLFSRQYLTELLLSYIDNLNVLYVALTRAESALYVFTENTENKSDNKIDNLSKNVGALLKTIVAENVMGHPGLHKVSGQVYTTGELVNQLKKEEKERNEVYLSGNISRQKSVHQSLRLRKNYEGFLDENTPLNMVKINRGKLMHELLSSIVGTADIDTALKQMADKGAISTDEIPDLQLEINVMVANPLAKNWFDGSMTVLNEKTILSPGFSLSRPDRVMTYGEKAIVVDYKLGSEKSVYHQKQVGDYRKLLLQMGYQTVEGYVWYLKDNRILNIETDFQN